ncbi:hypothetical protein R3P38DRAFT_2490250, partial [Favolaschia claudopus]
LRPELARYDTEISRLTAELEALKEDRAGIQDFYDECSSIISPVRRLPPEILTQIFTQHDLACAVDPDETTAFCKLARGPLLDLSQVCARWHDIVMGTPSLWENAELESTLWDTSEETTVKMMTTLRDVLERGGKSPLFIDIRTGASPLHPPALQLLAEHSERWEWMSVSGFFLDLDGFSAAKGRLSRLTSIVLYGEFSSESISIFENAPRL